MKTHILRAPETDRKRVLIPNKLTDLDDYAEATAHGFGSDTLAATFLSVGVIWPFTFDTWANLSGVTAGPLGLIVGSGGLYLASFRTQWVPYDYGLGVKPVPAATLRGSGVSLDGGVSIAHAATPSPSDSHDRGSALIRLAGGEELCMARWHNDGGSSGAATYSELTLAKVAP